MTSPISLLCVLSVLVAVGADTGANCIRECRGVADGDYQYCDNCKEYITCSNSQTHIRHCPTSLEWDDDLRRCVTHSKTCSKILDLRLVPVSAQVEPAWGVPSSDHEMVRRLNIPPQRHCNSTGAICVKDCTGKADGDYQSCHGCGVYVSCVAGRRYDDRPCAAGGLVWDDKKKRCEWKSDTCKGCSHTNPCKGTGRRCVRDCKGLGNGDYQSCKGCDIYLTCSNDIAYDKRPCAPRGTVWDDNKKLCTWWSNTCFRCP